MYSDEHYWFDVLTHTERAQYERAVTAIIAYYDGHPLAIYRLSLMAQHNGYTASPLVRAVLWRLQQELAPVPEDD